MHEQSLPHPRPGDLPPRGLQLWWLAIRPKTLSIAVAPVAAGTALAVSQGHAFQPAPMVAALAGAILIQAGVNLHNDVSDALSGGDQPQRQGPARVTASGWASPQRVRAAALLCFALAAVAGLYLTAVGGLAILALGVLSLLAGWSYSGGPFPISHSPLGEVFVIAFFGIGAVGGSAWLQGAAPDRGILALGVSLGLLAGAVLMANNYRDAEPDRGAGRRTLAIVLGPAASRIVYAVMVLAPFALLLMLPMGCWTGLLALPLGIACVRESRRHPPGPAFNPILAATARCQLALAALMAVGLVLG
jgi:1,4-dihydroxy-2-naphthoate polyprenyltransferase